VSGRPLVYLAFGVALLAFSLLQVQTLFHVLQTGARLRNRVIEASRERAGAALPELRRRLEIGGTAGWSGALRRAHAATQAAEVELLDADGATMLSYPSAAPVGDRPAAPGARAGSVWTVGPVGEGESARILHYATLSVQGRPLVVRIAAPAGELEQDRRERRRLLWAHGTAVTLLVLVGGLLLVPRVSSRRPAGDALEAYEEAMARLQSRSLQRHAELQRLGEELRDKSALARVGELAGGIAHEMRNGLGTILGYARLIERGGDAGSAAAGILEECETLEAVIGRFVEFVRDEKLHPTDVDLGRMLSRVLAREGRSRPIRETSLEVASLGRQKVDEDLLERAFENLVRNALEAAGPGGRVAVRGERGPGGVDVWIEDDGPGMTRSGIDVSRPFASTKVGGLGLGLPLALKIVQLHGGELTLVDRSPSGLAVRVHLPDRDPLVTNGSVEEPGDSRDGSGTG
jgi:signal transduction histidine kinase